jgi:hypothetical protein
LFHARGTDEAGDKKTTQDVGFSPRKQNLTLYLMGGFDRFAPLMKKLGKYKTSGSCLRIKTVDDISVLVLKQLVAQSVKYVTKKYT